MTEQPTPEIVSREEWERARAELLAREKAHARLRCTLPPSTTPAMTPMDSVTVVGPNGPFAFDVFEGRRMLLVYFFMWNNGAPHHKQCEGCTHGQAAITSAVRAYLAERDVTYAVFSSGQLNEIIAYRDFMGWTTPWYSTADAGNAARTRTAVIYPNAIIAIAWVFQTYEVSEDRGYTSRCNCSI